jgi:hypothetical protein
MKINVYNYDGVKFVTLEQYLALDKKFQWLVEHAMDTASISRAKAADLLDVSLIDLDAHLGRTND